MATQEQLDLRKQWLEALRSGKYKQGQGNLRAGDCYCCLGVLCDIIGIPAEETKALKGVGSDGILRDIHPWDDEEDFKDIVSVFKFNSDALGLTKETTDKIGLKTDLGGYDFHYDNEPRETLAGMNDDGKTFEEIADFIEANYNAVFKD